MAASIADLGRDNEAAATLGRITRLALGAQYRELRALELCAAGICEQPIEAADDVPEVKSHRGHSARARPDLLGREARGCSSELLATLQQAVRRRHEQRREARQRATEPDFRKGVARHGREAVRHAARRA